MSLLRVPHLLAGFVVAVAFLLGAVCDWGQLSTLTAALGPGDALLSVLGLVLAAMTGAAGALIAADVRADMAAAQSWHEIHAETAVIATPAETAPTDRVDALYVAGPQDAGLRRILLAHRFIVPVPPPNGTESLAPEGGEARAVTQPAGTAIKPELQAGRTVSAADGHGERLTAPAAAQRKPGPQLISSNAMGTDRRRVRYTVRKASTAKRFANAGSRWDWPAFATAATTRVPGSDFDHIEIVLADRSGRDENSAPSPVAPEPEATVQPCSRGPPVGTGRRRVPDGPTHLGKPFRETDRSPANPPADLVVIDNLGERVPICEAELAALEAYLDDVLDDVLGSDATATMPT